MLTKKEIEVLQMLCRGYTMKEIADNFHRSPRTIETHINHLKLKLACYRKSQLVAYAIDNHICF